MHKISVFSSTDELAKAFAEEIRQKVSEANSTSKPFHLMLSGGTTPEILYKELLNTTPVGFSWSHVGFYWGDERCVPYSDTESNSGQARRQWLDHIQIAENQIHPLFTGVSVSDELKFQESVLNAVEMFDLVILGMGDDGHFASVFPDRPEMFESKRLCETAFHPVTKQQRITVTPYLLESRAKTIVILTTGLKKAVVLDKVFNETVDFAEFLPVAALIKSCENIVFYIDEPAASRLKVH
jgi:6-phosphogluconolactonase